MVMAKVPGWRRGTVTSVGVNGHIEYPVTSVLKFLYPIPWVDGPLTGCIPNFVNLFGDNMGHLRYWFDLTPRHMSILSLVMSFMYRLV